MRTVVRTVEEGYRFGSGGGGAWRCRAVLEYIQAPSTGLTCVAARPLGISESCAEGLARHRERPHGRRRAAVDGKLHSRVQHPALGHHSLWRERVAARRSPSLIAAISDTIKPAHAAQADRGGADFPIALA